MMRRLITFRVFIVGFALGILVGGLAHLEFTVTIDAPPTRIVPVLPIPVPVPGRCQLPKLPV